MEILGHTLPEIAGEKAGIFKPGVPAFTVPQRAGTFRACAAGGWAAAVPHARWSMGFGCWCLRIC